MAFGNTDTNLADDLKNYYSDDKVAIETFSENPCLAMMKKLENQTGINFIHPIVYGAGQSFSSTFADAQSMSGLDGEGFAAFTVTRVEQFDVANIASKTIDDTSSDRGAFLDAVTLITDQHLEDFINRLGIQTFGYADGNLGTISSTSVVSSATQLLTLTNPLDILHFEVGMAIDLAAAQTTGAVRAYGTNATPPYIMGIDYAGATLQIGNAPQAGTQIALTDATYGIPTAATGDYIYQWGCRNLVMTGFQSWVPFGGVTTTDNFFGFNRSVNVTRLAGQYVNGQGGEIREVLESSAAQVSQVGGKLSHFWMSFKKLQDLSKSLGAQQEFVNVKVGEEAVVGFNSIVVNGPRGKIRCIAERNCPSTLIAGMNMEDWQVNSVKKAPRLWDEDGQVWLRIYNASGMEVRFTSNSQILCKKPRNQINVSVTA